MSSQRAREHRIVEKLGTGALPPASPIDPAEPVRAPLGTKPDGEGRCHGCDELQADSLVGDQPWHHLCVLFWQGRSQTVRERHFPDARAAGGVTPERSRWVIVVRVDRPAVFATLSRNFAGSAWVDVVMDRRGGSSQSSSRAPAVDRRGTRRRRGGPDSGPVSAFRRAYRGDAFEVYEATTPLPGRCPQCGLLVTVELLRFAEPPVRLELAVVHEIIVPATVRHLVELQSLSATGRVLLASRLLASPRTELT